MRVEAIDAHGQGLLAPIHIADGRDDILAGLRFVVRSHRVFKIKEDYVGGGFGGLFEKLEIGARNSEFAAVQAVGGEGDGFE